MFILYTDGGSRGNPGPSATGYFLFNKGMQLTDFGGEYLGEATNNAAEYSALVMGMKAAVKHKVTELTCYLDSELIVKQLNGEYKVRDQNLKIEYEKVKSMVEQIGEVSFEHVPRAQNKLADKMVNLLMDAAK